MEWDFDVFSDDGSYIRRALESNAVMRLWILRNVYLFAVLYRGVSDAVIRDYPTYYSSIQSNGNN